MTQDQTLLCKTIYCQNIRLRIFDVQLLKNQNNFLHFVEVHIYDFLFNKSFYYIYLQTDFINSIYCHLSVYLIVYSSLQHYKKNFPHQANEVLGWSRRMFVCMTLFERLQTFLHEYFTTLTYLVFVFRIKNPDVPTAVSCQQNFIRRENHNYRKSISELL